MGFQAGDVNLYRYVGNQPTNLTDPSGLAPSLNPSDDRQRYDPVRDELPSIRMQRSWEMHVTSLSKFATARLRPLLDKMTAVNSDLNNLRSFGLSGCRTLVLEKNLTSTLERLNEQWRIVQLQRDIADEMREVFPPGLGGFNSDHIRKLEGQEQQFNQLSKEFADEERAIKALEWELLKIISGQVQAPGSAFK